MKISKNLEKTIVSEKSEINIFVNKTHSNEKKQIFDARYLTPNEKNINFMQNFTDNQTNRWSLEIIRKNNKKLGNSDKQQYPVPIYQNSHISLISSPAKSVNCNSNRTSSYKNSSPSLISFKEGCFEKQNSNISKNDNRIYTGHTKSFIENLKSKHSRELENLISQIIQIKQENERLKEIRPYLDDHTSNENQSNIIKNLHHKNRIYEFNEISIKKDFEFSSKKDIYNKDIEESTEKICNLTQECKNIPELESMIYYLTKKLQSKNEEVKLIKKEYMKKLQIKIDDQITQNKEWSIIYTDLIQEIRKLKKEIDQLGYENKQLITTINSSKNTEKSESDIPKNTFY